MNRWLKIVLLALCAAYVALALYMDAHNGMSPFMIAGGIMGFLYLVLR